MARKRETGASKKKSTISKKLSLRVLAILVPALVVLILVACTMASNAIAALNQEKLDSQTHYAVALVDGFFENKLSAAEIVSINPAVQQYVRNTATIADAKKLRSNAGNASSVGEYSSRNGE